MKLKEAYIENFGKLHKQKITFAPGINVLCGENEAGKTTLQEFITAMLFDLAPERGRSKEMDTYHRYAPWNAAAYYCGTLRFELGGRPFYLKRNFYHKEKMAQLINEADKEELSVEFGDLDMLLGNITKNAYLNTWCIRESGAVTGKELASLLGEYLANVENTGDANISLARALKNLETKRREILTEKKRLLAEKQQKREQKQLEERLLGEDIAGLKEKLRQQPEAKAEQKSEELPQRKTKSKYIAIFMLLVSTMNLFFFGRMNPILWTGMELFFILLTSLAAGIYVHSRKRQRNTGYEEHYNIEETRSQDEKPEEDGGEIVVAMLKEQLQEKQLRRSNVRESIEEMGRTTAEELENDKKEQAVVLAEKTIRKLSTAVGEDIRQKLYGAASQILSQITEGKYDKLQFDEQFKITVEKHGEKIPVEYLSRGTLEQVYFSVRLALGGVLQEEPLFYSFDDTFGAYDEKRLTAALHYLASQKNQSLIFTCSMREIAVLEENGIPYHRLEFADAR